MITPFDKADNSSKLLVGDMCLVIHGANTGKVVKVEESWGWLSIGEKTDKDLVVWESTRESEYYYVSSFSSDFEVTTVMGRIIKIPARPYPRLHLMKIPQTGEGLERSETIDKMFEMVKTFKGIV